MLLWCKTGLCTCQHFVIFLCLVFVPKQFKNLKRCSNSERSRISLILIGIEKPGGGSWVCGESLPSG